MAEASPSPVPASANSDSTPVASSPPTSQETPSKSAKQLRPDAPDFTPSPRPHPSRPSPSPHGAGRGQSPRGRGQSLLLRVRRLTRAGSFRPPRGQGPAQRAGSSPSPRTASATSVASTPSTPKEHVPRGYIPPSIQTVSVVHHGSSKHSLGRASLHLCPVHLVFTPCRSPRAHASSRAGGILVIKLDPL